MRRLMAALAIGALVLSACANDKPTVSRDGGARRPDDEGIATTLSRAQITLDGKRTYRVSDTLLAFSTYSPGKLEPMTTRKGQYVQIGLDGDRVVWMAGVAAVVHLPTGDARVFYNGVLRSFGSGRAVFEDGSVFHVASGVVVPKPGRMVEVELDPSRHEAVSLTSRS
jgi:hypothetical protein